MDFRRISRWISNFAAVSCVILSGLICSLLSKMMGREPRSVKLRGFNEGGPQLPVRVTM